MAKLIPMEEAASRLGVTPDELAEMRSRSEIFGYRDGSTWKFKEDELERVASRRAAAGPVDEFTLDSQGDELPELQELEDIGSSSGELFEIASDSILAPKPTAADDPASTVIVSKEEFLNLNSADADALSAEADVDLFGSDLKLAGDSAIGSLSNEDLDLEVTSEISLGSDVFQAPAEVRSSGRGMDTANVTEDALGLDRTLAEDDLLEFGDDELQLADSSPGTAAPPPAVSAKASVPTAAPFEDELDLDLGGEAGDDLLLADDGGSDVHSKMSLSPGSSGINLASPSESGLSLESLPPELRGSSIDSLQMGDDGMFVDDLDVSDLPADVKSDDDFLLTPVSPRGKDEADSGSQVVALDDDDLVETSAKATLTGDAPMFEEEADFESVSLDSPLGVPSVGLAGSSPSLSPAMIADVQFPTWIVVLLGVASLGLLGTGIMMIDLMRNMWSWDQPYAATSWLMDLVLGY